MPIYVYRNIVCIEISFLKGIIYIYILPKGNKYE